MKAPLLQQVFWAIAVILGAFNLVTGVLQGFDAAFDWVSPTVTYAGTAIIFFVWVFVRCAPVKWTGQWVTEHGQVVPLGKAKFELPLSGILLVLWGSWVYTFFVPLPATPELDFSMSSDQGKGYAPGFEVNGLKWKSEFTKHTFSIENKSKTVETYDLRTALVLPGPIYNYKVKNKVGVDRIDINRIGIIAGEYIDEDGRVVAARDIYSNAVFITVDRLRYESYVNIELILDLTRKNVRDTMSIVDAKYWYSGNNGKKTLPKSEVYNVKKIDASSALYIDKANPLRASPLSFDYEHSFIAVLGENTDVKYVEDKHFRFHVEYPFMIPTDKTSRFTIRYLP
jgi:hypothetical protein